MSVKINKLKWIYDISYIKYSGDIWTKMSSNFTVELQQVQEKSNELTFSCIASYNGLETSNVEAVKSSEIRFKFQGKIFA